MSDRKSCPLCSSFVEAWQDTQADRWILRWLCVAFSGAAILSILFGEPKGWVISYSVLAIITGASYLVKGTKYYLFRDDLGKPHLHHHEREHLNFPRGNLPAPQGTFFQLFLGGLPLGRNKILNHPNKKTNWEIRRVLTETSIDDAWVIIEDTTPLSGIRGRLKLGIHYLFEIVGEDSGLFDHMAELRRAKVEAAKSGIRLADELLKLCEWIMESQNEQGFGNSRHARAIRIKIQDILYQLIEKGVLPKEISERLADLRLKIADKRTAQKKTRGR